MIIANNITIPTDNDFAIAKGINVDKVVANGVTVWEKNIIKTVNNAPPFAGAGWQLSGAVGGYADAVCRAALCGGAYAV